MSKNSTEKVKKNHPILFYCGSGGISKYDIIAKKHGWKLGINSGGKNKINGNTKIDFVDNNWKNYQHDDHLATVKSCKPILATVRDIESITDIDQILFEAEEISKYCQKVVLIPKVDIKLPSLNFDYILGYSVPTKYGSTLLPLKYFYGYPTHLLGGSCHIQAQIVNNINMQVYSLDCKDFALCAKYGKSTWPNAIPKYQKINKGCYEAFELSVQKIKEYYET